MTNCKQSCSIYKLFFFIKKNSRPISAKITLDENFQKTRQENYQKNIERERMEKEIERERMEKENYQKESERERMEKEKLQRENEEMKNKLSQLSTLHSSSLLVN
jgi:biopolymer transport protein ExbB/TolQ